MRTNRDKAVAALPDWELRDVASQIERGTGGAADTGGGLAWEMHLLGKLRVGSNVEYKERCRDSKR